MSNNKVVEFFGCNVFDDSEMQKRLPKDVYNSIHSTMKVGTPLRDEDASVLAEHLKNWAIEKGATHFTHWFQPMTGITAEKHESFISPTNTGDIIAKFRAKELIKGEPDASSFPSGGIRATFEARGYTAFDPTSFAFIKDNTLCIPTAFFSYSGDVLDKKTPLLRSNQALSKQSQRILKLFNSDAKYVNSSVGAEQEYFLIDKSVYLKRKDLIYCGRTLLGVNPPKGQQLDDHYFGAIKPRVMKFMKELDVELWKLGILAKTEHNEVAPAQHEMAPAYTNTNLACDQNQLIMEMMKKVADRNGMHCLLHEKPFANINGSGKHINWSILTDTDVNLLEPGNSPEDNAIFLLFLSAIIKAVDNYSDLLRATVASAGNDCRLGASEAPPAIISIFVGSNLEAVINGIVSGVKATASAMKPMNIGVDSLPSIPTDTTDRNRTSPFAFTGNKFEFRSPGSSFSIADPCTVINTIVAESLCGFADILEKAEDFNTALNQLIYDTLKAHSRVLFSGDGYSDAWVKEAKTRGLLNIKNTTAALPYLTADKNIELFTKHGIFSRREIESRQAILYENYSKIIRIEALTMVEMIKREIIPACLRYQNELAQLIKNKNAAGLMPAAELEILKKHSQLCSDAVDLVDGLLGEVKIADTIVGDEKVANFFADTVKVTMDKLRVVANDLEKISPRDSWPMPTYGDILYSVN
jgi:glutamine synthetase